MKKCILILFILFLQGCTLEFSQIWCSSSYCPVEHRFQIDSAYLLKYGMEQALHRIKTGTAVDWMTDSIPYAYVKIEKKRSIFPVLPFLLRIEYQKESSKHNIQFTILNERKMIKSFDSLYFCIIDSSTLVTNDGKFILGNCKDLDEIMNNTSNSTSYAIDMTLNKNDIVYGSFKLFYTDIHNNSIQLLLNNLKFKNYHRTWYMLYPG